MITSLQSAAPEHTRRARLGLLLALFALLLAPVGLLADKAVVPLVIVTALAGGLLLGRAALPWRIIDRPLALAVGLLVAWCLIASTWSLAPPAAAKLALRVGLLLYVLLYLVALAGFLDDVQRARVARGFCFGFAAAALIVLIELVFGGPIFSLLEGPARTTYLATSRLNRGVSDLAILVWPLAALAWHHRRHVLALALPPAVFALTVFSESSASVVALAGGLLAAVVASLGRSAARLALALAVAGTLLAAPLAVNLMQRAGLEQSALIPETGQYRLHIWKVVTARIAERPVLGWGFDASPDLPTGDAQPFRPGHKVIPSHPHNGALQIMVELGMVGSLLSVALLFVVGQRIDRLSPARRPAAVAMTITIIGVACAAYSIWQSHWLAVIGAAATIFVAVLPRDGGAPPAKP